MVIYLHGCLVFPVLVNSQKVFLFFLTLLLFFISSPASLLTIGVIWVVELMAFQSGKLIGISWSRQDFKFSSDRAIELYALTNKNSCWNTKITFYLERHLEVKILIYI